MDSKEKEYFDWYGMPEFNQKKIEPFFKSVCKFADGSSDIICRFDNIEAVDDLCLMANYFDGKSFYFDRRESIFGQNITAKTKSIWHPFKSHWGGIKYKYISESNAPQRYPVYIVSKGRSENGLTTKALNKMGVDHYIVVEESEFDLYSKTCNAEILKLPESYLDEYDTFDKLGNSKSKGPGAARNFCIDHSSLNGFKRHWVMDDNLDAFHYLNENEKYEVECSSTLRAAEDFIDRYSNIPVAGFNYYSFCKKTDKVPPYKINTRIYSCLLIDNHSGYRWRGRYNEDTDLSLRVIKDGLCTLQFNSFLCGKVTTQRMKGGNTKEFYSSEGTLPKSEMLQKMHPDVASVVYRFNRWHHHVDYRSLPRSRPKLNTDECFYVDNNYGLKKIEIKKSATLDEQ